MYLECESTQIYNQLAKFPLQDKTDEALEVFREVQSKGSRVQQELHTWLSNATIVVQILGGLGVLKRSFKANDFEVLPYGKGGISFDFMGGNKDYTRLDVYMDWEGTYGISAYKRHSVYGFRGLVAKEVCPDKVKSTIESMIELHFKK